MPVQRLSRLLVCLNDDRVVVVAAIGLHQSSSGVNSTEVAGYNCRLLLKPIKLECSSYSCSGCTEAGSWGRCTLVQASLPQIMFSMRKEFRRASSKAVHTGKASVFEAAENGVCNCSSIYHIAMEMKTLSHLP